MSYIQYWDFNEHLNVWTKKFSSHLLETKYEKEYFRSIRDGHKEFYLTEMDHYFHMTTLYPFVKKLNVWSQNQYGEWKNSITDIARGTREVNSLYKIGSGDKSQYYWNYNDYLEHLFFN